MPHSAPQGLVAGPLDDDHGNAQPLDLHAADQAIGSDGWWRDITRREPRRDELFQSGGLLFLKNESI